MVHLRSFEMEEAYDASTLASVLDQLGLDETSQKEEEKDSIGDKDNSAEEEEGTSKTRPKGTFAKLRYVRIPLPRKRFKRMNFKEIADVIRVSLMRMQTKNPMDDDFYYQVYSARKGEPWKGVGFPGENVSGLAKANNYRYEDGTPKLPEGTLGKIASSSVRKPKKLVDLTPEESEQAEKEKGSMFASFSLQYLIEEGIRCLMRIEDIDGLLMDEEDESDLVEQKKRLTLNLLEHMGVSTSESRSFSPDHLLYKFAQIPKGRVLVLRSLLLLPYPLAYEALCVILGNIHLFCHPVRLNQLDSKASDAICEVFSKTSPDRITVCMERYFITQTNLKLMKEIMRSKTGAKLCDLFFRAGHSLRQNPSTPPELIAAWLGVFSAILSSSGGFPSFLLEPLPEKVKSNPDRVKLFASTKLCWDNVLHLTLHANQEQLAIIRQDKNLEIAAMNSMRSIKSAGSVCERLFPHLLR